MTARRFRHWCCWRVGRLRRSPRTPTRAVRRRAAAQRSARNLNGRQRKGAVVQIIVPTEYSVAATFLVGVLFGDVLGRPEVRATLADNGTPLSKRALCNTGGRGFETHRAAGLAGRPPVRHTRHPLGLDRNIRPEDERPRCGPHAIKAGHNKNGCSMSGVRAEHGSRVGLRRAIFVSIRPPP